MHVQEAYPLFIAHGRAERQYAKETQDKHKECFLSWILPHWDVREVEEITRTDVIAFRSKMVDANLSINRQYSILMVLKVFFRFCRDVLKLNCLDPDREIRLPQRPKPHVVFLTNEEIDRIQGAIPTTTFTGFRLRVLVEVLLNTGLRISEALALDRTPFEMGNTEVEIIGKGGKHRKIFFPEGTL